MHQISIDICSLPEVDQHLVVCTNYFSKWLEAKPSAIARFLYEVIFRHRCMQIHINNQRMEFVHEVSKVLHNMIGTEQCIISAYRPQSNGLKKRQNKNIEELLLKVLDGNPCDWPNIINLFTHRVSKHTSPKFSPFFLMYNRVPTLPIDVKYSLQLFFINNQKFKQSPQNKQFLNNLPGRTKDKN